MGSYSQSLWTGVTTQLLVADELDPTIVYGSLTFYGYDERNSYGHLAFIFSDQARELVWPLRGVFLFLEHLFTVFPIRFLIGESLEFNFANFRSAVPAELVEVIGSIPECEFHAGRYWDKYQVRVTRDGWERYVENRMRREWHPDEIIGLVAGVLEVDPMGELGGWLDTQIGDLGLDSLSIVELCTALNLEYEDVLYRTPRDLAM
jgi:hypothetical protein